MRKMGRKEQVFCEIYAECGNARFAAATAGYTGNAYIVGTELLADRKIARKIAQIRKRGAYPTAEEGLRKIAFGNVSDAVKMIKNDEDIDVERLDLFNIAEIKKPKDGSLEIKFYDRIKALEALCRIYEAGGSGESAASFFAALEESGSQNTGVRD